MHSTPRWWGRSLLICLTAVVLAVGMSFGASASPASATSAAPTTTSTTAKTPKTTASSDTRALCPATPKKGMARCFAMQRTDIKPKSRSAAAATAPDGFAPADITSAYQFPSGKGAGQTVAIVDAYDDPTAEADLAAYRAQYNLPACTTANGCFKKVDQRGGTDYPEADAGWAGEISLDLDMVSAVCPSCNILLVEADGAYIDQLGAAVDTAVSMGAKYVSNSYGGAEDPNVSSYDKDYYDHPGVAITASTGDYAFDAGPQYPATSPYVTAVGGTSLTRDDSTRGWHESAWSMAGSGCSAYETKPDFQHDTGCDKRAEADISAVADPATGVAVYDSFQSGGWGVVGGTSASAPIIAAGYALAGPATGEQYPNSFPYLNTKALNDVTEGNNGACDITYICTSGTGYDGPTGLGTPIGVTALSQPGPHGTLAGTVTDKASGKPIADASIKIGDQTGKTDADGKYTFPLEVGTYDLTVSAYGYGEQTVTGLSVADGQTTTQNVALTATDMATISGTVKDGSGHGWPVYAKITVDGVPTGPWYTDPKTGTYSFKVPTGNDYTVHADPVTDGYATADATVQVTGATATADLTAKVTENRCVAQGYQPDGLYEEFDSLAKPAGWTTQDKTDGGTWNFDDPGGESNRMTDVGGAGGFASIDSEYNGYGRAQDSYLVSPAVDLSDVANPELDLSTDYFAPTWSGSTGAIEVSVDGGTTWRSIWSKANTPVHDKLHFELPDAAHQKAVQVRFHYTGSYDMWWEIDNVFLGQAGTCSAVPGGLAIGQTIDANTQQPIAGSTVRVGSSSARSIVTDDKAVGDGFYSLFVPGGKQQTLTASHPGYQNATGKANFKEGQANSVDFRLTAGRAEVTSGTSLSGTGSMTGSAVTKKVTVTNKGTAPVTVRVAERSDGMTTASGATKADTTTVKGTGPVSNTFVKNQATPAKAGDAATSDTGAWTDTSLLPTATMDSVAAVNDGKLYSVGGFNGSITTAAGYVYDPINLTWSPIAKMETARQRASGSFIGGKLYVAGGWNGDGSMGQNTVIYDPSTNSWSNGADMHGATAAGGTAVLNGKLFIVGGCTQGNGLCKPTSAVNVYDPKSNTWSRAADYPKALAWQSCGTVAGKLYCAGGDDDGDLYDDAYVYNPTYDSWSKIASMPAATWGATYASANGELIVTGGIVGGLTAGTAVNTSYAYDPTSDSWSKLPSLTYPLYRATSAPGYYVVGGAISGWTPRREVHVLPGYDADSAGTVPWLTASPATTTLKPGQSTQLTVSLNAAGAEQPGTYQGAIEIGTDGPYHVADIPVSLTATAPKTWANLSGTVSGQSCSGTATPLFEAQLEMDGSNASFARRTDAQGHYDLWADVSASPLSVIASKDGYQPAYKSVTLTAGANRLLTSPCNPPRVAHENFHEGVSGETHLEAGRRVRRGRPPGCRAGNGSDQWRGRRDRRRDHGQSRFVVGQRACRSVRTADADADEPDRPGRHRRDRRGAGDHLHGRRHLAGYDEGGAVRVGHCGAHPEHPGDLARADQGHGEEGQARRPGQGGRGGRLELVGAIPDGDHGQRGRCLPGPGVFGRWHGRRAAAGRRRPLRQRH